VEFNKVPAPRPSNKQEDSAILSGGYAGHKRLFVDDRNFSAGITGRRGLGESTLVIPTSEGATTNRPPRIIHSAYPC
jgi:hypothetical protein